MEHNFKTPEDVTKFESQMAKNAKYIRSKDKKKLEKAAKTIKPFISVADRYKTAWERVYCRLPKWRQNEIDIQMKSGKLSDNEWDNDFVRQVTALVESDDF